MKSFTEWKDNKKHKLEENAGDEMLYLNIERPLLRALQPVEHYRQLEPEFKKIALAVFTKWLNG